jgi:peptidoglycan/xylan/chitin deacetylase (PgdA/CDA1 family)
MDLITTTYSLRPLFWRFIDLWAFFASMPKGYAILCYHRILSSNAGDHIPGFLRVNVDSFKHQMHFIKSQTQPIALLEMVDRIKDGIQADRLYVAVTFDDGYADNLEVGYPILREFQIPATIFISTAYVDNRSILPWWDELHYLVGESSGMLAVPHAGSQLVFDLDSPLGKRTAIAKLSHLIGITTQAPDQILALLRAQLPDYAKPSQNAFANWTQLAQIVKEGLISVGGHTVTHPHLIKCDDLGRREIAACKVRLEEVLGIPVSLFAYPFGKFNQEIIEAVNTAKFHGAVTGILGINQAGENPFCLKRIPIQYSENQNHFLTRLKLAENRLWYSFFNRIWTR